MTRRKVNLYFCPKGFSLIDLLIAMFIGSIILLGVYKSFMTGVEQTTIALDLASLDSKTRNVIKQIQTDIEETNGNQLQGLPTIAPDFDDSGNLKGFVLVKQEKKLPLFKTVPTSTQVHHPYTTPFLDIEKPTTLPEVNSSALSSGSFIVTYNFRNYAWVPHQVESITYDAFASYGWARVEMTDFSSTGTWLELFDTGNCISYNIIPDEDITDVTAKVCDSNGKYIRNSNVEIPIKTVRYEFDDSEGTIYRILNEDVANKSLVTDKLKSYELGLITERNVLYPDEEQTIITEKSDAVDYLLNIKPNNHTDFDDCTTMYKYKCFTNTTETGMIDGEKIPNKLAWGLIASKIKSININMKLESEDSGRSRQIGFRMGLDENYGSNAFTAFMPTKIVGHRHDDPRKYASSIANPYIYDDPEGGGLDPYLLAAAAPMVSIPTVNDDPLAYDYIENVCDAAYAAGHCNCNTILYPGTPNESVQCSCPGYNYPSICTVNNTTNDTDPTTADYSLCKTSTSTAKLNMGCGSPQGALTDNGLAADNKTDPKIVFLDKDGTAGQEWDISNHCSSGNCLLSSWYSGFGNTPADFGAGPYADSFFPLTVFPALDYDRVYVGTARWRYPWKSGIGSGQNGYFFPKYYSTVIPFDIKDVSSPKLADDVKIDGSSQGDRILNDIYLKATGDEIQYDAHPARFDLDSVSQLAIRNEETGRYMYITSHNSPSIGYRRHAGNSIAETKQEGNIDNWSELREAFQTKNDDNSPAIFPVKATWEYQEEMDLGGFTERFTGIPTRDVGYNIDGPPAYVQKRVANILADEHEPDRIYFTEMVDNLDELYDEFGWFARRAHTYTKPIIRQENLKRYACDPSINDINDPRSVDYKAKEEDLPLLAGIDVCKFGGYGDDPGEDDQATLVYPDSVPSSEWEAKPIDWAYCTFGCTGLNNTACTFINNGCMLAPPDATNNGEWSDLSPRPTNIVPDMTSALKVAFKKSDNQWLVKTIAKIHAPSTALFRDPLTGDIMIGETLNVKRISIDAVNDILDPDNTDAKPLMLDLSFKRPDEKFDTLPTAALPLAGTENEPTKTVYTSNNVVGQYSSIGEAPSDLEFRRLAGLNIHPDSKKLKIVYSDMQTRTTGFILQERNWGDHHLIAQVIERDSSGTDLHYPEDDTVMVYPKGSISKSAEDYNDILPWKSTRAWTRWTYEGDDGLQLAGSFPEVPPIPVWPTRDIYWNYKDQRNPREPLNDSTGVHTRRLSTATGKGANVNGQDALQCPNGDCAYGQSFIYRDCEADVLSNISMGLMGRQIASYGCGLGAPASVDVDSDPWVSDQPPTETTNPPVPTGGGCTKYCDPAAAAAGEETNVY